MAAARSEQEREVTNRQLDAFHKTFNFCMSCRQYTCGNCWNEGEGRCLTCSPHVGHEILPAPFPNLEAPAPVPVEAEADRPRIAAEAWPALDLTNGSTPTHVHLDAPDAAGPDAAEPQVQAEVPWVAAVEPEVEAEVPWVAAVEPEVEAEVPWVAAASRGQMPQVAAVEPEVETEVPWVAATTPETHDPVRAEEHLQSWAELMAAEAGTAEARSDERAADGAAPSPTSQDPIAADRTPLEVAANAAPEVADPDVAAVAASRTRSLLGRFRPGQSVDAEIAAFEQGADAADTALDPVAEVVAEAVPEVAAEAVPEVVAEAVPEVAAEAAPDVVEAGPDVVAEPVEAAPPDVAAEAIPEVAPQPSPRTDVVEQPVWRIVAPDESGTSPAPADRRPPDVPAGEPQWPTATQDRLDFLRRPRTAEDVWSASTNDLFAAAPTPLPGTTAPVAIQACSGLRPLPIGDGPLLPPMRHSAGLTGAI